MKEIIFQKIIGDRFGYRRNCSYIYGVNEARSRVAEFKNKGYEKGIITNRRKIYRTYRRI